MKLGNTSALYFSEVKRIIREAAVATISKRAIAHNPFTVIIDGDRLNGKLTFYKKRNSENRIVIKVEGGKTRCLYLKAVFFASLNPYASAGQGIIAVIAKLFV
jgi:hypothetical protein